MDEVEAEQVAAILAALKSFRKGEGLLQERADFDTKLFKANSWGGVVESAQLGFDVSSWWTGRAAIYNALNMEAAREPLMLRNPSRPRTLLADRRLKFAEDQGISLRTVMRLEEKGAETLADFIYSQIRPKKIQDHWIRYKSAMWSAERAAYAIGADSADHSGLVDFDAFVTEVYERRLKELGIDRHGDDA